MTRGTVCPRTCCSGRPRVDNSHYQHDTSAISSPFGRSANQTASDPNRHFSTPSVLGVEQFDGVLPFGYVLLTILFFAVRFCYECSSLSNGAWYVLGFPFPINHLTIKHGRRANSANIQICSLYLWFRTDCCCLGARDTPGHRLLSGFPAQANSRGLACVEYAVVLPVRSHFPNLDFAAFVRATINSSFRL